MTHYVIHRFHNKTFPFFYFFFYILNLILFNFGDKVARAEGRYNVEIDGLDFFCIHHSQLCEDSKAP